MKLLLCLMILIVSGCSNVKENFAERSDECKLKDRQKEVAWQNVVKELKDHHPEHSKYCALDDSALSKRFRNVEGVCRVFLGCSKEVDGVSLHHGELLVEIDIETQQVLGVRSIAW